MKNRFLFVDIFKIVGILLVLLEHLFANRSYPWLAWLYPYYLEIDISNAMYYITYSTLGIWLFIVASGCSLSISHPNIDSIGEIREFYTGRFWRIYPAYWAAILFAIAMHPQEILGQSFVPIDYVRIISGFESFGAETWTDYFGKINNNFWFITLIVSLYLLFPIIQYAVKKHPHISILSLLTISVVSRYYMSHGAPYVAGTSWFALCSVFAFGLGIYLAKTGLYPKKPSTNVAIVYLSNLSFYIYLTNGPLLDLVRYPIVFIAALLVSATLMYAFVEAVKRLVGSTHTKLRARRTLVTIS